MVSSYMFKFFLYKHQKESSRDGEIDDGGILFNEKVILGESLDVEDKVRRKSG